MRKYKNSAAIVWAVYIVMIAARKNQAAELQRTVWVREAQRVEAKPVTTVETVNRQKFTNPTEDLQPVREKPVQEQKPKDKLTKSKGVHYGESGRETYYNLPMGGVVKIMRGLGYTEEEYPYWTREDGCKMLGEYIIIAANLDLRPRGTLVETSLGTGIVCDTGSFCKKDTTAIDIAVNW